MNSQRSLRTKLSGSTQFMGTGCVLAGSAAAATHGNFELLPATLCLVFAFFAQLSGNFYQRYRDEANNLGGFVDQRIMQTVPSVDPTFLRAAFSGTGLLAAMTGLALITMGGFWTLGSVAAFLIVVWVTFGEPMPLIRTPYAIVSTFLLFGPIGVISTSFIQSNHEATGTSTLYDIVPAIPISIAMGLMAVCCNLIYSYAAFRSHIENSRRSFATVFGLRKTTTVFLICTVAAPLLPLWRARPSLGIEFWLDIMASLITLLIGIWIWHRMKKAEGAEWAKLINYTNFNMFLYALMLLAIHLPTGVPDDSHMVFFTF